MPSAWVAKGLAFRLFRASPPFYVLVSTDPSSYSVFFLVSAIFWGHMCLPYFGLYIAFEIAQISL